MSKDNIEVVAGFAAFIMIVSLIVAMILAGFGRFEQTMAMLMVAVAAAVVLALLSLVKPL